MDVERVWVLLAKRKAGEATNDELAELDILLNTMNGNAGNEMLEKVWQAPIRSLPEMKPDEHLWSKIEESIGKQERKVLIHSRNVLQWFAAAMITAVIGSGTFLLIRQHKSDTKQLTRTVSTKPLVKKHLVLPDGTRVWLNSNSELSYDDKTFGERYREVKLTGEAFFDVIKDAAHPFVIHAAVVNITVKGTAFNVKAYPGQKKVETSLIRGLVEITTQQDPERKILLKPNEKIAVSAEKEVIKQSNNTESEQALFVISKLQKDKQEVLPETVWMNSSFSFDNESFEELSPKLESWFSVSIHIDDEALKAKRFSGMIKGETLQQTLDALKLSYPFSYRIKSGEVWIDK